MTSLASFCEIACQIVQKKLEGKRIEEEQAAKAQNRKLPVCYDEDNDKEESNSLKDNNIFEIPSCSAVTPNEPVKEKTRKGQNRIKTGQKQEACRSQETFKAVTVGRGRKTEQNAKRMAKNANAVKSYSNFKRMKKRKGPEMQFFQSSTTRARTAH
nr:hypothetical protein [Tanacetum cinerariifolium]